MRALVFLASIFITSAQPPHVDSFSAEEAGSESIDGCAVNGAEAVSELETAVVYMWAASQRCSNVSMTGGNPLAPRCEVDIASALQAVNNMVLVVVKAAKDCGAVKTENYACGMAVGEMTSASAGLTAALGGIVHRCTKIGSVPMSGNPGLGVADNTATNLGKCVTDAKNAVENIFKATNVLTGIKTNCEAGSKECAVNSLHIVSFLGAMGSAMAATAQHCAGFSHIDEPGAACAKYVVKAVSELSAVGSAGMNLADKCVVPPARLYELEKEDRSASPMSMMILGAFLPVVCILGFFSGRIVTKAQMKGTWRTKWQTKVFNERDNSDEECARCLSDEPSL